jgi:hypothetical protein
MVIRISSVYLFQLTLVNSQRLDIIGVLELYRDGYLRIIYEKNRLVSISYG